MFLESCKSVAKLYPKITFESMIVDNTCMQVFICKLQLHSEIYNQMLRSYYLREIFTIQIDQTREMGFIYQ